MADGCAHERQNVVVLVYEMDSELPNIQDMLGNTLAFAPHPLASGERE
jgi:hypothetical protein